MYHVDLRTSRMILNAAGTNPAFEILLAVTEPIESAIDRDVPAHIWLTLELTPGQVAAYAIRQLEMEVNSGGFDAYFRYTGADTACEALEGLRRIGAAKFAVVLQKAVALFPGGSPPRCVDERETALESILARTPNVLNSLDLEFYDAYENEESLAKLLGKYMQMNPTEFFYD